MTKEIVDAHNISFHNGIIGCPDYTLAVPEVFSLKCEEAKKFRNEGIVEQSMLICRKSNEHKSGALGLAVIAASGQEISNTKI